MIKKIKKKKKFMSIQIKNISPSLVIDAIVEG